MFVVLVVCLAVCVGTSWGHFFDDTTGKAEQAKDAAAPTVYSAMDAAAPTVDSVMDAAAPTVDSAMDAAAPTVKSAMDAAAPTIDAAAQKSGSFASWAYDKISRGLGFGTEEPVAQTKYEETKTN
ncbi:hypothetical protein HKD37_16G045864 [Glycine soja]